MKYNTATKVLHAKRDEDIGIDLPSAHYAIIFPHSITVIDTGIVFEFPLWSRLRRAIYKFIFGIDVIGIAGLVKGRGRTQAVVMAGVVDAGYRGTIKVKLGNLTENQIIIEKGDRVAQLVPVLSINAQPVLSETIRVNTERGEAGGINVVR